MRVFLAMGLVVLAGAGTLLVVSLLLGPAIFHRHLAEAGAPADLLGHVEEGFAVAALVSTFVGALAAGAVAVAGALFVARRIGEPIAAAAHTASELSGGHYSTRMSAPAMGPELAELATALNSLADRLEASEATRVRLMSDLAHELRTPVAAIEATAEAIADQVLPADPDTLAVLTDQTARLARLIDDLAAVSRAEERAFGLDLADVDLVAACRASVGAAAARFARAGLVVTMPAGPPIMVRADAERLREVIDQLLANALWATPPGGSVTFAAHGGDQDATLTVTDTGCGFDPGDAERIFARFYRSDPARANQSGSGIGLTIARALVEAQGGHLSAASAGIGRGATLTLVLPRAT
jgi:signal transduction histidine kinase